ncbi:cytochrome P450 family protein [Nocardiopsis ansamitocini]|nr:cytochrome P450 [Nocardiopsis ansamitocini]
MATHPDVKKGLSYWSAFSRGEIPPDWPLISWVAAENMFTADGERHDRLRRLVSTAFTPRRIEALRSRVEQIVAALLDDMASGDGTADLKESLARPLPMTVITELFGVDAATSTRMTNLVDTAFDTTSTPETAARNQTALMALLGELVAGKRDHPGDDMTSTLISARDDSDRLSESELVWTLILMIGAGYETTMNLIANAVHALLTNRDQLGLILDGSYGWDAAVEEALRWNAAVQNVPLRYAAVDITIQGVTVPAGDPILLGYGSANRDPAQHGPDAHLFDITRQQRPHLAFSRGAHYCLGASLARLEAETALRMLWQRFPDLVATLEDPPYEPSIVTNGFTTLPVAFTP